MLSKFMERDRWWIAYLNSIFEYLNSIFVVKFRVTCVSKKPLFSFQISTRTNVSWIINNCQPDIFPLSTCSRFLISLVNCLKTNASIFAAKIVVGHEEKYACLNCHNKLYNSYHHTQPARVLLVASCSRSRQWRYVKTDFTYLYHMLRKLNIL